MKLLKWIRTFDLKKAGICGVIIGSINILLHILVITGILPFTWVNGGRTETFSEACVISTSALIMTIVIIVIALIASKIIPIKLNKYIGIALSVFLIITLPLTLVGVIQQFLGTIFEKCVTSIIMIIGLIAHIRLAFEKRW